MGSDVLGCLDLANHVFGVTADAFGSDFNSLDHTLGVDDEGTAVGQALIFAQNFEVAADLHGRVTDHGVLDLADGFGAVVPCFVGEVGVGGDRVHFNAHFLQLVVVVGNVAQLGRANEGEVSRVEEENGPLAFNVGFGQFEELAVFECRRFERFDFGVDNGHVELLCELFRRWLRRQVQWYAPELNT